VDFEPVKAKIEAKTNGQDPERAAMGAISGKTDAELDHISPDQLAQLRATAALFPDELIGSELGAIPKGWGVSTIGVEFIVTMGQSPPGHTYNENQEGTPFFQGRRDFKWRYPVNRVFCTAPKRFAQKGDTLLSVRAPVGDVNKAATICCIGRGLAALRHKSGCEAYTYYTLKKLEQYFNNFDTEGTVFGSINQKDLKDIKITHPNNTFAKLKLS
jgi:type I restriction enzyme S subunit